MEDKSATVPCMPHRSTRQARDDALPGLQPFIMRTRGTKSNLTVCAVDTCLYLVVSIA